MFDYETAITRPPCARFAEGLTHGKLGKPDVALAVHQHEAYVKTLAKCGVEVIDLHPDNDYPDSCFTEDEAIVTDRMAVIPSFCRPSRQGEEQRIRPIIESFYRGRIEEITKPGTLEGGDICRADHHFFIGISSRTNEDGARQFADIVKKYGFTSAFCDIREIEILHLTTGMSYIGNNTVVCCPDFRNLPALKSYKVIVTEEDEAYAANCIRIHDKVIIPEGFPKLQKTLIGSGFDVVTTPMSEIEKQDGGLSCLSIRVPGRK